MELYLKCRVKVELCIVMLCMGCVVFRFCCVLNVLCIGYVLNGMSCELDVLSIVCVVLCCV